MEIVVVYALLEDEFGGPETVTAAAERLVPILPLVAEFSYRRCDQIECDLARAATWTVRQ